MLVVVRLVTGLKGSRYYSPVDQASFGILLDDTGRAWFSQREWSRVDKLLEKWGSKLTNRWYHIVRRTEPSFLPLIHLPSGETIAI